MKPTAYLASLAALSLSLLAGCGGNVVVDKSGLSDGGSGGAGGSGGGSGTTTTTTVTSTSDLCGSACKAADQYDCLNGNVAECVSGCIDSFATYPECTTEITNVYNCAVENLAQYGCSSAEQACQMELAAYSNCMGVEPGGCGSASCTGDTYSCSCSGDCNGSSVEVTCKGQPGSTADCQCLVNGQYVGSCQDNNLACDFYGCCAAYLPL